MMGDIGNKLHIEVQPRSVPRCVTRERVGAYIAVPGYNHPATFREIAAARPPRGGKTYV